MKFILPRLAISALIVASAPRAGLAAMLTLEPSGQTLNGVSLSKSALSSVDGRTSNLTTVGGGLRAKRVAVVNVKVYVAQLLLSEPAAFQRTADGALASVAQMKTAAIHLEFLRGITADQIMTAFRESMDANHVDAANPTVKGFLKAVSSGGDAATHQALTILVEKLANGSEVLSYEDTQGRITTLPPAPAGIMHSVFSIWLGNPADEGLNKLKTALLAR